MINKVNIFRIIPAFKVGGVESGILREMEIVSQRNDVFIHILILGRSTVNLKPLNNCSVKEFNFNFVFFIFNAFLLYRYILKHKGDRHYVISSLWKSHIYNLLIPISIENRYYFFHSSSPSHFIDKIVTNLVRLLGKKFLFDSYSTKKYLNKDSIQVNNDVIFYNFRNDIHIYSENDFYGRSSDKFDFVFLGRINKVNRLDRSIDFIRFLHKKNVKVSFDIYGPDEGHLSQLKLMVEEFKLDGIVRFHKPVNERDINDIYKKYCFYLQTSEREGLGASVLGAMSHGLVPFVSKVGEIPVYCNSKVNSYLFDRFDESDFESASEFLDSLYSVDDFLSVSKAAYNSSHQVKTFRETYTHFIDEIVSGTS